MRPALYPACAALVVAIAAWALRPLAAARVNEPQLASPAAKPARVIEPLNLAAFHAPIWVADAPPAEPLPDPEPAAPLRLQLLAVFRAGESYRAALYDPDTDRLLFAGPGDKVGAGTIDEVRIDRVALRSEAGVQTLSLRTEARP